MPRATKVVGRPVPEDTNTEALAHARFDGEAIATPGVRGENANEPVRSTRAQRNALSEKRCNSETLALQDSWLREASPMNIAAFGATVAPTSAVRRWTV